MPIELQKPKKPENRKNKQQDSLITQYTRNTETEKIYQLYTREFSSLDSDSIKFYFDAAQKGINFFKAFLFEEIRRRDLRIGGLCQTRKLSVLGEAWDVEGKNEEHVDFVKSALMRININQLLTDIVEAQLQGMSVFQLFYDFAAGKQYLTGVSLIPNYLIYNKNGIQFLDFSKLTIYDLRAQVSSERPTFPTIDLDPMYYFECYSFDGNEENGLLNGLIDSIILGYFFKSYGLKDWSVFIERFASPAVIGEYDPLMSKPDREMLTNAVNNFGNLFRATIPNTAKITMQGDNNKLAGGNLYENYQKYWNDELSIRILGQAMTTDTGQGGSYAKALVGNMVREDYKAGDKSLITQFMNEFIRRAIIDPNFASVSEYPQFKFVEQENLDYKNAKADLLVKLKQAGFDADEEDLKEIFGLTLTKSAVPYQPAMNDNIPRTPFSDTQSNAARGNKKAIIEQYLLDLWTTLQ